MEFIMALIFSCLAIIATFISSWPVFTMASILCQLVFVLVLVWLTCIPVLQLSDFACPLWLAVRSVPVQQFTIMFNPVPHLTLVVKCYWLNTGFGLVIEFTGSLLLIITNNCNTCTIIHDLQIATAHSKSLSLLCLHALVAWWWLLMLGIVPTASMLNSYYPHWQMTDY
jgi:hypothetical protein